MFYIVLGKSNFPTQNRLFTEVDIEKLRKLPQAVEWKFVPIEVPWSSIEWIRKGGRGNSPYPEGTKQQTIRCPKTIAFEVQQYAIWLASQHLKPHN